MTTLKPDIIALSGLKRSGKDAAAKHLVSKHGFTPIALADPLWDIIWDMDPIIDYNCTWYEAIHLNEEMGTLPPGLRRARFKEYYPDEYRRLMCGLGDGLNGINNRIIVSMAIDKIKANPTDPIVITDLRLPHEKEALDEFATETGRSFRIWHVDRGLVPERNPHWTEQPELLGEPDAVLDNTGTLGGLHDQIDCLL